MKTLKEMIEITGAANGATYNKKEVKKVARVATKEEIVETVLDGVVETTNVANEGDYIISGLAGERYIVRAEKFNKLYESTDSKGGYKTKPDSIKAVEVKEEISFIAPWGSEMIALPGDFIAFRSNSDAYRIEKDEFEKTYELA